MSPTYSYLENMNKDLYEANVRLSKAIQRFKQALVTEKELLDTARLQRDEAEEELKISKEKEAIGEWDRGAYERIRKDNLSKLASRDAVIKELAKNLRDSDEKMEENRAAYSKNINEIDKKLTNAESRAVSYKDLWASACLAGNGAEDIKKLMTERTAAVERGKRYLLRAQSAEACMMSGARRESKLTIELAAANNTIDRVRAEVDPERITSGGVKILFGDRYLEMLKGA